MDLLLQMVGMVQQASQEHKAASTEVEATQKAISVQIMLFHQTLQLMGKSGDTAATQLDQQLFPRGANRIIHETGHALLSTCRIFSLQLHTLSLPLEVVEMAQKIEEGIQNLSRAIETRDLTSLQKRKAQQNLNEARDSLLQALKDLKKIMEFHISPEEIQIRMVPLQAMLRPKPKT